MQHCSLVVVLLYLCSDHRIKKTLGDWVDIFYNSNDMIMFSVDPKERRPDHTFGPRRVSLPCHVLKVTTGRQQRAK